MRNNIHIYKSTYTDVKTGVEVDPFFIVHKCKNLKEANNSAMSYLYFWYSDKGKATNFLNSLNKLVKITHKRLVKL